MPAKSFSAYVADVAANLGLESDNLSHLLYSLEHFYASGIDSHAAACRLIDATQV